MSRRRARLVVALVLGGGVAASSGCGIVGRALQTPPATAASSGSTTQGRDACGGTTVASDLSADEKLWAEAAWNYVRQNTNATTGLVNATDQRPVVSVWDIADAIAAIYAAHELGLIDRCEFDDRFGALVASLNLMPLVDNVAPNRWYSAGDRAMVGPDGKPAVLGWSPIQLGRLLVWLRIVEARHPVWSEYIGRAVARWNFCRVLDGCGALTRGVRTGAGAIRVEQDGRLGYEEYAAAGFALWGFDVAAAAALDHSLPLELEGLELKVDARAMRDGGVMGPLTSAPFTAFEMEIGAGVGGSPWAEYRRLGQLVAQAQYRRFERTRTMTARTHRPLATPPWEVYDSVWVEGYPWNTVDPSGGSTPHFSMVSTAAVFELWAVYPHAAATRMLEFACALRDQARGFYAGRLERTGGTDRTLALRTNAAVLQALLYRRRGTFLKPLAEPSWLEVNSRDEFFRPGRCLPAEPRICCANCPRNPPPDPTPPPAPAPTPAAPAAKPPAGTPPAAPATKPPAGAPAGAPAPKPTPPPAPKPSTPPPAPKPDPPGSLPFAASAGHGLAFAQQTTPATGTRRLSSRGWSISAGLDVPLSYDVSELEGEASQGELTTKSPRASVNVRYAISGNWFGRISFHRYLDQSRRASWNPDFAYALGYDDWRPGTLSFVYENQGGNRLNPNRQAGETVTRLEEGTFATTYKIPVPRWLEGIFVPRPENRLSASVGLQVTPRFRREAATGRGEWKRSVSLTVRNRFFRWFFAEARAIYYPAAGQQQPWDPDFTYAFGYFNWTPGAVSVQYSNYAANRFPWNNKPSSGGAFRDGGLSVSWSQAW